MMTEKKEKLLLAELLEEEHSQGKKILLLGKEGIFTFQEITRFLKKYQITVTQDYEENIIGVIEHHQLNPVEEDISCMAYDEKIPLYTLVEFEKLLSVGINEDELLMVIKLSNDQERIMRLLSNENILNTLFVKLLEMYAWSKEDDDRDDRDVIMFTLRRYVRIRPNEEDLLHTYLTLRRLATETTDASLLFALIGFPNFSFLVRGKDKISLRETIAKNAVIDKRVIDKLLSLRDEKVNVALAFNPSTPLDILYSFIAKKSMALDKALATNTMINDELFEMLLEKEEEVLALLLYWQPIDLKRLEEIGKRNIEGELFALIGANSQLSVEVQEKLLQMRDNIILHQHLCANVTLSRENLEFLYHLNQPENRLFLAGNRMLSPEKIEALYREFGDEVTLLRPIAQNPSTPIPLLRELFERDVFEINQGLATNASVPLELLDILKVDTRLRNELTQNAIFVSQVAQQLDY